MVSLISLSTRKLLPLTRLLQCSLTALGFIPLPLPHNADVSKHANELLQVWKDVINKTVTGAMQMATLRPPASFKRVATRPTRPTPG